MSQNDHIHYHPLAKGFHWITALLVLILMPLGFYMVRMDFSGLKLDLYALHKSLGLTVLVIVALRLLWRLCRPAPPALSSHAGWEKSLAKAVHWLFYIGLIGMPLTGWIMSSAGAFPNRFFGLFDVPSLTSQDAGLFSAMRTAHTAFAWCLTGGIALHVAGALKHHIIDRDGTLRRMMPLRFFTPFLIMIIVALAAAGIGGAYSLVTMQKPAYGLPADMAENIITDSDSPLAAPEAQTAQDPPPDIPSWIIDRDNSRIGFTARAQGSRFNGFFNRFDGTILFSPDRLEDSRAVMSVDISSIESGSTERDGYIKMRPWLFAAQYPQARFTSERFAAAGEGRYKAFGMLEMRGISQPVEMTFDLAITKDEHGAKTARMNGDFTIDRLAFDIGRGEWEADSVVSHEITITVSLAVWAE